MKVKIDLTLNGVVLEHGSLLADLFIVRAFSLEDGHCVNLSYHIDEESANLQLKFDKSAYDTLYRNFFVYKTSLYL